MRFKYAQIYENLSRFGICDTSGTVTEIQFGIGKHLSKQRQYSIHS